MNITLKVTEKGEEIIIETKTIRALNAPRF